MKEYSLIGIYSFGKGIFHREKKSGAELGDYRFCAVEPGDLVISNIQAWEGAIAYAGPSDTGTIGTHRFLTYVPATQEIDSNWARYLFLSPAGFPLIQTAAPGTVKRNRTLAVDRFEALEIPLPPLQEQLRAVEFVDRGLSIVTRLQLVAARQTRLQGAMISALAQRRNVRGESITEAGWRNVRLGDVMTLANDSHTVDAREIYPNVGIYSFGRGLFEKPPIDGSTTSARSLNRLRAGQFVYSRLFAFEGAYAEVTPRFDGYFVSNEFPAFDVDPTRAVAGFVAAYLRSPDIWAELARGSKGLGLRRQRILVETLLDHRIWLPPLEEQKRTLSAVNVILQCAEKRTVSDGVLSALRRSLLNRAFASLL